MLSADDFQLPARFVLMIFEHGLIATLHRMSGHAALEVARNLQEQLPAAQHGRMKDSMNE